MERRRIFLNILIFLCAAAALVSLFLFHEQIAADLFLIGTAVLKGMEWKFFGKKK